MELLESYGSDDEAQEKAESCPSSPKEERPSQVPCQRSSTSSCSKKRLPPPPDLVSSLSDHHGGRIRSFPHVNGNWATHVFLSLAHAPEVTARANQVISQARAVFAPREFTPIKPDDLHVSLSQTFPLRYHQISLLKDALSRRTRRLGPVSCVLDQLCTFSNDDGTRTFIGLRAAPNSSLSRLIDAVDKAVVSLGQPPYYSERATHVSVAWALGGDRPNISSLDSGAPALSITLEQIVVKSGHLISTLKLNKSR